MHNNMNEPAFKEENIIVNTIVSYGDIKYKNRTHVLKEKGITQRQLASMTGITQAAISQIATGTSDPSMSTLVKIANALDIPLRDLFSGKDENVIICPHCGGKIRLSKE